MKKMEIYGDSILRGVMYCADSGRYDLCRKNRFASLAEYGIEAKNNSRMGATIARGFELLKRNLAAGAEGTVVLFEFGGNDCDFKWEDVSANPEGKFQPYTPEKLFTDTYREMIRFTKEKGAVPVLASLVPIDADKYMNWISRNLNYQNILRWLGDVSMLSRWQEYYSRIVEKLAYETGCPLLDLRSAFLLSHNYKEMICEDGIHPTLRGHELIDRALVEFCTA
jgi:lysophospholipase L1-like esterase